LPKKVKHEAQLSLKWVDLTVPPWVAHRLCYSQRSTFGRGEKAIS